MAERKYALTKLRTGDYVCPSNDAKRLWRFCAYEDGADLGLDVEFDRRTYWLAAYMPMSFADRLLSEGDDLTNYSHWTEAETFLPTRKAAIAVMLKRDEIIQARLEVTADLAGVDIDTAERLGASR